MNPSKTAAAPMGSTVVLKSNRLGSLFDQLDKLWPIAKAGQADEKDVDHAISSWDIQATLNIVSCFNELLTSGKRIGALTDHELPDILLKTLTTIPPRDPTKDPAIVEELIIILHVVFSKMGTKDKRFAVQARMTGALQVSLNVAKHNPQNFKVLHPVLQVLKIYANSPVNCNIMVKGGAIETLLKILPFCGQKRVLSAKAILEILALLVKSKIGARRAVLQGSVPLIMSMFVDWHRTDHRHRQIAIRKAILTVLKNIVMINSGRKALAQIDGMKILYSIGMEGLECKELDSMIKLIILILRRCYARSSLPLKSNASMFSFRAQSPFDTESSTDNSEDETNSMESSEDDVSVAKKTDNYQLDIDENDEEDDDDRKMNDKCSDFDCDVNEKQTDPKIRRDLEMYQEFVKELFEYKVDPSTQMDEELKKDSPIRIPTATMDSPSHLHNSSDEFSPNQYGLKREYGRIQKSSSLDGNCILTERKNEARNVIFSSDSDTEAEFTTKTMISNCGSITPRSLHASPSRCKTPSMPLIPSQRTFNSTNFESMDLLGKGMHLRNSCVSTPSLRDLLNSRYSPSCREILDEDNIERTSTSRCEKPRSVTDALSAIDLQQRRGNDDDDDDIEKKHLLPFVKEAAPGVYGHYPVVEPEPLLEKKPGIHRVMIFQDFYRFICPERVINRVVFDLDDLISGQMRLASREPITSNYVLSPKKTNLQTNKSSNSLANVDDLSKFPALQFESRFECGNLRKAIQIRQYEYDLLLNTDINSDHHCQWFYFEVSNMEPDVAYRFNIINCEKFNSQFNFGMQPVMYSTKDAEDGQPGWERTGSNVCYYKNFYQRKADGLCANKYYFTATFTVKFPYADDVCYLAYHYPYTFSMMKAHICKLEGRLASNIYYDNQILCFTSHGNECDVITVTERPNREDPQSIIAFRKRPYIVLTSRVHPGESCSSWVIKGALDFLMSGNELAIRLRETFIFKIVPCLNPDGVINGNHRCSISGDDLNRQWISPDPTNHPTIFHTKGLIQYLNSINKPPLVYCDFHGHSRRKNVFMYGCSVAATNAARQQGNSDTVFFNLVNGDQGEARIEMNTVDDVSGNADEDTGFKTLPRILNAIAPAFSIQSCSYIMEKSKEATARIVVFKELGVLRSYTLESTYCGADQGPYKGNHFGTRELEEMGKNFCVGLLKLSQSYSVKLKPEYFSQPCFEAGEKDEKTDESQKSVGGCQDRNSSRPCTPEDDVEKDFVGEKLGDVK